MVLDRDVQALIAAGVASGRKAYQDLGLEEGRAAYRAGCAAQGLPKLESAVRDLTLTGPHGPLGLRLYRPPALETPAPAILFLHGGGWVIGDLDTHDPICRRLAARARALVLAVDYRRSPEHRFPVALDEARAALSWLSDNAAALGGVADRLAVAGDSAGGNLAAVLALLAGSGEGPALRAQALFYPVTDLAGGTPSYGRVTEGVPLTAASMAWFREQYLAAPTQVADWRVSPLRAPSLAKAPPTFLVSCGQDPLADEGVAYARRLEAEGVAVAHLHLSDQIHGLLTVGGRIGMAGPVLDLAGDWLAARLKT